MPDTNTATAAAAPGAAPQPDKKPIPEAAAAKAGGAEQQVPKIDEKLYPVGIVSSAGAELEGGEREVPEGEPPPLPVNAQLKWIGKPTTRLDGRAKVTGAAKYTADVNPPGMLFARML